MSVSGLSSGGCWGLRAGYPDGAPATDYVPLFALLRRRLSDDEVRAVAREMTASGVVPVNVVDIEVAITKAIAGSPSAEEVERVKAGSSPPAGRSATLVHRLACWEPSRVRSCFAWSSWVCNPTSRGGGSIPWEAAPPVGPAGLGGLDLAFQFADLTHRRSQDPGLCRTSAVFIDGSLVLVPRAGCGSLVPAATVSSVARLGSGAAVRQC